jgi:hypothetical protein
MSEFKDFLLKHEQKELIELTEARGGSFKGRGKYIPRKVIVRGSGNRPSHEATRYFLGSKPKPKEKLTKAEEKPEGKVGHIEKKPTEKPEKSTVSFTDVKLGDGRDVVSASDGKHEVFFDSRKMISHYGQNFRHLIDLAGIHKLANPMGLKGRVEVNIPEDNIDPNKLNISFTGKEGYFNMSLYKDLKTDKLDRMSLDMMHVEKSQQGKGIVKDFFKKSLANWDRHGIKEVLLLADIDVGGYAWAKYGFDFATAGTKRKFVENFKKKIGNELEAPLDESQFKHSWDIANAVLTNYNGPHGNKIGKEFLLDYTGKEQKDGSRNGWYGELDLTPGSPGRTQLESYLKGDALKPVAVKKEMWQQNFSELNKVDVNIHKKSITDAILAGKLTPENDKAGVLKEYPEIERAYFAGKKQTTQPKTPKQKPKPFEEISSKLNLDFNGWQESVGGIKLPMFTDKHTGTTFMARGESDKDITERLKAVRGNFLEAPKFKPTETEHFLETIKKLPKYMGDMLSHYTKEEVEKDNIKFHLSEDGLSGYGIKGNELTNLFSLVSGHGSHAMKHALQNGATQLDCFDGRKGEKGLPGFYTKFGFVEYKREKNWTAGEPDIVYMHIPEAHKLK